MPAPPPPPAPSWHEVAARASGMRMGMAPAWDRPALRQALEALFSDDGVDSLPRIARGKRAAVGRLEVDGARFAVKRYDHPRAFLLRTFLRASRARREAEALAAIEARVGNPVQAVAWAQASRLGFVPRSWVVTTELPDCFDLRRLRHLQGAEQECALDQVLERLPPRVADLHRAGFFARSLHGKNVLLQPATGALAFIDLPWARWVGTPSRGQRCYDLACLWKELRHTVAPDAWRSFLSRYGQAVAEPTDAAAWFERIDGLALRLANRTPLAGAVHALRKRFRRTRLGEALTGHRYAAPCPGAPPRPERRTAGGRPEDNGGS